MSKVFLKSVTYVVDLSEHMKGQKDKDMSSPDAWLEEGMAWDRKLAFLEGDITQDGFICEHVSTRPELYDTDLHNIGKCAKCGAWTTDIDEDDAVFDVIPGAKIDDILYCDACLPKDHKWAL